MPKCFLPWSCGHPFRGSVTVQINRQEQKCPSLAKGWAQGWAPPQAIAGNCDPACCQLYRLFSTLVTVVGFTTCSQLCRLFSAFKPVLSYYTCSWLCSLSTAVSPVLIFGACSQLSRLSSTLVPVVGFTTCYWLCSLFSQLSHLFSAL